jgi:hypothetical protein
VRASEIVYQRERSGVFLSIFCDDDKNAPITIRLQIKCRVSMVQPPWHSDPEAKTVRNKWISLRTSKKCSLIILRIMSVSECLFVIGWFVHSGDDKKSMCAL